MSRIVILVGFVFVISTASVFAQTQAKIGYVYPAGGKQGTTVQVLIGGRQIGRPLDVIVSGTGVQGRVLSGCRMFVNDPEVRDAVRSLYMDAKRKYEDEHGIDSEKKPKPKKEEKEELKPATETAPKETFSQKSKESLDPDDLMSKYPYLNALKDPTAEDLQRIYYEYFSPRPDRKPKETLAQGALVELTIDAAAPPGDRDLRLLTGSGLTPPIRFQVGTANEIMELEPNDVDIPTTVAWPPGSFKLVEGAPDLTKIQLDFWNRSAKESLRNVVQLPVLETPVVLNGQIRGGDVDRFRFNAREGQKLVIGVRARHLIPFLADAVPGWFQAAITLFGPDGKIVAEASSYKNDPDPVILYEVPKSGVYTVQIQDSIFRGRDDFVYRISVGETPFITSVFPLGGRMNKPLAADIRGWNLPENVVMPDMRSDAPGIHELTSIKNIPLPYPIRYAVDTLPEKMEKEPNDSPEKAESIKLPIIVNGRIGTDGDVDCFRFKGRIGQKIVLDVAACSLGSSLDGILELLDSSGKIIASNDDRAGSDGPNIGLETHHADPYVFTELPSDGEYIVRLFNADRRGGPDYGYRLRVSEPQPDFAVYAGPTSVTLGAGNTATLQVHVVRKDGFHGGISLRLSDGQRSFSLKNETIPADTDKAACVLTFNDRLFDKPVELRLKAVAVIDGNDVSRSVVAVDDYEQAFIYHHSVPADSIVVTKPKFRRSGK